jgi:hypothetical protein
MAAGDTDLASTGKLERALALVATARVDRRSERDPSAPPMAISIAGVSTACSNAALLSSAEAVRKTLTPE